MKVLVSLPFKTLDRICSFWKRTAMWVVDESSRIWSKHFQGSIEPRLGKWWHLKGESLYHIQLRGYEAIMENCSKIQRGKEFWTCILRMEGWYNLFGSAQEFQLWIDCGGWLNAFHQLLVWHSDSFILYNNYIITFAKSSWSSSGGKEVTSDSDGKIPERSMLTLLSAFSLPCMLRTYVRQRVTNFRWTWFSSKLNGEHHVVSWGNSLQSLQGIPTLDIYMGLAT